jgi:hypothetical protein
MVEHGKQLTDNYPNYSLGAMKRSNDIAARLMRRPPQRAKLLRVCLAAVLGVYE